MTEKFRDDVETRVQKFCDAHLDIIKFAIERNVIGCGNRMLGHDGKKRFETGLRDLIPTIDNSELPAAAYEALQKIIVGVALVSVGAAYAEATKAAIISKKNREAANHPRLKNCSPIRIFIKKRLNRNPDISNDDMLAALDSEAENGMDGDIVFSTDKASFVVLGKDGNPQYRLARRNVPRTISDLKAKIFRALTG
jgi:hypothetical protein